MTAARRLAAILAADVVGYSRLMGDDEAGTARPRNWSTEFALLDDVADVNSNAAEADGFPNAPHDGRT
jgi:class 3 adenylate cyclase